jgi:anti-sigma B factor antagonist
MPTPPFLPGSLDLYAVDALRTQLLQLLTPGADVRVDLREVRACDLAGLQLLCAARRTAETIHARLVIENPSAAVLDACVHLGVNPSELSSSDRS